MTVRLVTLALLLSLQSCLVIPNKRMVDVDHSIVVTESGVAYEDRLVGTGDPTPEPGMQVTIDYVCTLEDGSEIDSTYSRGQAKTYSYGESWPAGIDLGLVGMRVGGRRRLIIPSAHAYGEEGVPGLIPPDSTLFFEIELVGLE